MKNMKRRCNAAETNCECYYYYRVTHKGVRIIFGPYTFAILFHWLQIQAKRIAEWLFNLQGIFILPARFFPKSQEIQMI